MTDAYPLAWPEGWPRTPRAQQVDGRNSFKRRDERGYGSKPWTFADARDALVEEVGRMRASGVVLSTNFPLGRNMQAVEPRRRPEDEGVAVYFTRAGRPYVMACDRYTRAEENMRSLALSLDALRTLERHGGGTMLERAFSGFVALPAPKRPHEILGVEPGASADEVRRAWRAKVQDHHPDLGGTHNAMAELNAARDSMLKGAQA